MPVQEVHKRQATEEQRRMADLVSSRSYPDAEARARSVMEVTNCTLEVANLALDECAFDTDLAAECVLTAPKGKWDFTPSAKTKKTKADSSGQRRGGFGNTHVNGSRGGASSRRGGRPESSTNGYEANGEAGRGRARDGRTDIGQKAMRVGDTRPRSDSMRVRGAGRGRGGSSTRQGAVARQNGASTNGNQSGEHAPTRNGSDAPAPRDQAAREQAALPQSTQKQVAKEQVTKGSGPRPQAAAQTVGQQASREQAAHLRDPTFLEHAVEKKANLASGVPPGAVLVPDTAHESDYKYIFPYSKDEKGKGLLVRVSGACRIARSPVPRDVPVVMPHFASTSRCTRNFLHPSSSNIASAQIMDMMTHHASPIAKSPSSHATEPEARDQLQAHTAHASHSPGRHSHTHSRTHSRSPSTGSNAGSASETQNVPSVSQVESIVTPARSVEVVAEQLHAPSPHVSHPASPGRRSRAHSSSSGIGAVTDTQTSVLGHYSADGEVAQAASEPASVQDAAGSLLQTAAPQPASESQADVAFPALSDPSHNMLHTATSMAAQQQQQQASQHTQQQQHMLMSQSRQAHQQGHQLQQQQQAQQQQQQAQQQQAQQQQAQQQQQQQQPLGNLPHNNAMPTQQSVQVIPASYSEYENASQRSRLGGMHESVQTTYQGSSNEQSGSSNSVLGPAPSGSMSLIQQQQQQQQLFYNGMGYSGYVYPHPFPGPMHFGFSQRNHPYNTPYMGGHYPVGLPGYDEDAGAYQGAGGQGQVKGASSNSASMPSVTSHGSASATGDSFKGQQSYGSKGMYNSGPYSLPAGIQGTYIHGSAANPAMMGRNMPPQVQPGSATHYSQHAMHPGMMDASMQQPVRASGSQAGMSSGGKHHQTSSSKYSSNHGYGGNGW